MKQKHRLADFFNDTKKYPSALWFAIASFFVMGLGQLLNRQKRKAIVWFMVPVLVLAVELLSSNWFGMQEAYRQNPVMETEHALTFRDYGGFFTKGLWGLGTLGRLVIDDSYRGRSIVLSANALGGEMKKLTWLSADNSMIYLALGLVALALLLIVAFIWFLGIVDAFQTRVEYLESGKKEEFGHWVNRVWTESFVYIILAVPLVAILFISLIPMVFSFLIAFTDFTYRIKLGSGVVHWVGFDTFKQLSIDPSWYKLFGWVGLWTVLFAVIASFSTYIFGFINALIIESPRIKAKKVWRTIMIIPWAFPALVTLMMFKNVFDKDGLMNQLLIMLGGRIPADILSDPSQMASVGNHVITFAGVPYYDYAIRGLSAFLYKIGLAGSAVPGTPDVIIYWLSALYNGNLAKAVVCVVNLWLGTAYYMMMITGTLTTIPRELYEAAHIDGATGWQRFRYITLPMVIAATAPALIMTFTYNFNNFGAIYFLTGGGPAWDPNSIPDSLRVISNAMPGQTDILISWIYKLTFTGDAQMFNVASVYSIIIFLVIGAISVPTMLRSKSFTEDMGE